MKEFPPSNYIPEVDAVGRIIINGHALNYIEADVKKFLHSIGVYPSQFMPGEGETSSKAEWKKEHNKRLFNHLGMSPRALRSWAAKLWYKHNVVPVQDYSRLFRGKSIRPRCLATVKANKPILDQAVADGQHNILPLLNATGKTPAQLKEQLGKGLWKSLCANTFSRNLKIANFVRGMKPETFRLHWNCIQQLPTSLIPERCTGGHNDLLFVKNSCRGIWSKKDEVKKWWHIAMDTRLIASRMNEPYSNEWSARRMKEEHDRLTALELAKKYSKDTFPVFDVGPLQIPLVLECENGYSAHLLTSPYAMQEEGTHMRHCVAGYSDSVASGDYLVYSVKDAEGNRKSTIGLHKPMQSRTEGFMTVHIVDSGKEWKVQQHHAACNQRPSVECLEVENKLMELIKERR